MTVPDGGWATFLLFTTVLMGGAGFLAGQALARGWRPLWQIGLYSVLVGLGNRFLVFALFGGELLSIANFLLDTLVILGLMGLAYRLTRVRMMVRQYPWLYVRSGPLGWRERRSQG